MIQNKTLFMCSCMMIEMTLVLWYGFVDFVALDDFFLASLIDCNQNLRVIDSSCLSPHNSSLCIAANIIPDYRLRQIEYIQTAINLTTYMRIKGTAICYVYF